MRLQRLFLAALWSAFWGCIVVVIGGISACEQTPSWKSLPSVRKKLAPGSVDVTLPGSLWKKVSSVGQPVKMSPDGKTVMIEGDPLPTEMGPLKVYLVEKNRGILGQTSHEISYPSGGGELDLAAFVEPLRGSFYFAFEFLPEAQNVKKHVFFLSNSVIRKIGEQTLGSGCDTYFDLTQAASKAMSGDGFLLNTTDHRHISFLAGTFFFAAPKDGKLMIASLTVFDSRHRELHCRH